MSHILVIRPSSLGDIILVLPALHALREAHPSSHIALLVRERYASLVAGDPVVDEVIAIPRDAATSWPRSLARRWDLVIDLSATGRSRALVRRLDHGRTVTVKRDRLARWTLIARARWRGGGERPAVEAPPAPGARDVGLRFLEAAGVDDRARAEAFIRRARPAITGETRARARRWLEERATGVPPSGWIALLPGASHPAKSWPVERFAALAKRVSAETGGRVLVLGGDADRPEVHAVARATPGALEWCGDDDLGFLAALLEPCRAAVANDSGPGHLAAALGVPLVSLFGPTVSGFGFAPRGAATRLIERPLGCRPCSLHGNRECRLGTHACLRDIAVGEVLAQVGGLLRRSDPEAVPSGIVE